MTLRDVLRYRHAFRAWIGWCDGETVALLVSGPVA